MSTRDAAAAGDAVPVWRWPARWLPVALGALCALLSWLVWPDSPDPAVSGRELVLSLTAAGAAAAGGPAPHAAAVVVVAANAVLVAQPAYPVGATAALLVVLVSLGARHGRRTAVTVGAVLAAGAVTAAATAGPPVLAEGNVGSLVLLVCAGLGVGQALRRRAADRVRDLRERDLRTRRREREAALEERRRIAREMHDVIAHHLSSIAVQAQTLPYTAPGLSERARTEVDGIAGTARDALAEMRRLLTVLRDPGEPVSEAPAPTLAALDDLLAEARGAGADLRADVDPALPALPDGLSLGAYRVVQEALTNARKHAPGRPVTVRVAVEGTLLVLRVANALPAGTAGEGAPGHGVIGMRERAELLGGRLRAGPDDGRFEVVAELPLPHGEFR